MGLLAKKSPVPEVFAYRSVESVCVGASTLAERDTLVPAKDEARATDASLHTRQVAGATGGCGLLAARLGAGRAARVVMAACGALQSWREGGQKDKRCLKDILE